MSAPARVLELVDLFKRNIEAYKSGRYNETQVRREFIDPLFKELGWDVDNRKGYAEAYKDVIHEDAIRIGAATKAPDYCFRIGGTRKFFLEAKKPSVNVKDDMNPAYQLRRYAWSAKLGLSILTDFEEMAVYDSRVKPVKTDKASTARVMYLDYTQYADRWDEIASIFSREAVLRGSFDKYAETSKRKKGTAEVDQAFLLEIEEWRDHLARNLALRNTNLTNRQLNFAVQKTIDRIIFLRICEDRGIERYGELQQLLNGNEVYERMLALFRRADDRYNSGLFHFTKEKGRPESPDELTPGLVIDDKVLKDILRRLYYPESPYAFSVLPAEILGHVYEQFLGKVITLTAGHRAKIEEKPEVKKAGGVYYTPSYIVDYIVENTVGKLTEGKTPRQVEKIKILDPACGSGSFLLGAYQYLLDWHLKYYLAEPKKWLGKKDAPIIETDGPASYKLTAAERKRILLNNIYGVDIDGQAVEVTKLSLLLKVLEGEKQLDLFHRERALPDLGGNIKCGNSLIGTDFYKGQQGGLFDEEEQYKINAFDWEHEFKEIFSGKSPGFDAVIGNPPYGAEFPKDTTQYLKDLYSCFVWRGESYLVFIEKAINLLKDKGQFSYIVPDTYLNLDFTRKTREFILQSTIIHEVVLLPAKVFQAATVDTTLLFLQKSAICTPFHENNISIKLFSKKNVVANLSEPSREFKIPTKTWFESGMFLVRCDEKDIKIIQKIEKAHRALDNYAELLYGIKVYQVGKGNPPQTAQIRDSKPYTSSVKKEPSFLPFFEGKHVGRYCLTWDSNNWVKYGGWLAEPRKPEKYEGEKILIRKIVGKTLIATYYPKTSYCNTLVYVLKLFPETTFSYYYLVGLLNSNFIGWYFKKKYQIEEADTFPQIMIRDILGFHVPNPKDKLEKLVSERVKNIWFSSNKVG